MRVMLTLDCLADLVEEFLFWLIHYVLPPAVDLTRNQ
jgi:hypothetical protein